MSGASAQGFKLSPQSAVLLVALKLYHMGMKSHQSPQMPVPELKLRYQRKNMRSATSSCCLGILRHAESKACCQFAVLKIHPVGNCIGQAHTLDILKYKCL